MTDRPTDDELRELLAVLEPDSFEHSFRRQDARKTLERHAPTLAREVLELRGQEAVVLKREATTRKELNRLRLGIMRLAAKWTEEAGEPEDVQRVFPEADTTKRRCASALRALITEGEG